MMFNGFGIPAHSGEASSKELDFARPFIPLVPWSQRDEGWTTSLSGRLEHCLD
jgi:hypothetical protein